MRHTQAVTRGAVGSTIGGYRLERFLGEGAAGVVFEATGSDGGRVAVKLLRPELLADEAVRSRFVREERIARSIDSAHVGRVISVGEEAGDVFLVLPLFEGGSLAARLAQAGRLDIDELVRLSAELGRGLDDLHGHGIVHRDVKPSNVLFTVTGQAILCDFGLARGGDWTRLTLDGQLLGTPHYMAPELIEGREATSASDLYALGCVLYECLAGAPPFSARHLAELGFAHMVEPPPHPRERRPEVPEGLGDAILLALAKEPEQRPTTATALARMIHHGRTASPR